MPDTAHIFRMTDDTGMFQHALYAVPNPAEGYTTDDNARALVAAQLLCEQSQDPLWPQMRETYLRFLLFAEKDGWFRNFLGYDRRFEEERGSEDCFGRCVGSLGFLVSRPEVPDGVRGVAETLLQRVRPGIDRLHFLRSKAYALAGLCLRGRQEDDPAARALADGLMQAYARTAGAGWHWFEDEVTYANAVLPWALLLAAVRLGEPRCRQIGLESLQFLVGQTFTDSGFCPVGCQGWLRRGGRPARYDQQPLEAAGTFLACRQAARLTGDDVWCRRAQACCEWFTGCNIGLVSLIDPQSGGCMDGLTPDGPNRNEGAESLVVWMITRLISRQPV